MKLNKKIKLLKKKNNNLKNKINKLNNKIKQLEIKNKCLNYDNCRLNSIIEENIENDYINEVKIKMYNLETLGDIINEPFQSEFHYYLIYLLKPFFLYIYQKKITDNKLLDKINDKFLDFSYDFYMNDIIKYDYRRELINELENINILDDIFNYCNINNFIDDYRNDFNKIYYDEDREVIQYAIERIFDYINSYLSKRIYIIKNILEENYYIKNFITKMYYKLLNYINDL